MKTENLVLLAGAGVLAWMYFSKQQQTPQQGIANSFFQLANQVQPGLGDSLSSDLGSLFNAPGSGSTRLVGPNVYGQPAGIQYSSNPLASSVDYGGGNAIGIPTSVPSDANNTLASSDTFRPTPSGPVPVPPSAFTSFNQGQAPYVGATITPSLPQAVAIPTAQQYVDAQEGLTSGSASGASAFEALHTGDIVAFDILAGRNQANESAAAYMTIAGGRDRILSTYSAEQLRQVAQKYYGGSGDLFGTIREGDLAYLSTHS